MVGDRLDNDIRPSAALGFKTVWVKQGYGALGNPDLLEHKPDYTLDSVVEIIDIFFFFKALSMHKAQKNSRQPATPCRLIYACRVTY